jgi:hypothetical protein
MRNTSLAGIGLQPIDDNFLARRKIVMRDYKIDLFALPGYFLITGHNNEELRTKSNYSTPRRKRSVLLSPK